ncbi:MAG: hypothetical protein KDK66_00665 [Deltaproteobacteria bacterium]|nr:hypothetical protein [Deltaproteobacteria bacterium]
MVDVPKSSVSFGALAYARPGEEVHHTSSVEPTASQRSQDGSPVLAPDFAPSHAGRGLKHRSRAFKNSMNPEDRALRRNRAGVTLGLLGAGALGLSAWGLAQHLQKAYQPDLLLQNYFIKGLHGGGDWIYKGDTFSPMVQRAATPTGQGPLLDSLETEAAGDNQRDLQEVVEAHYQQALDSQAKDKRTTRLLGLGVAASGGMMLSGVALAVIARESGTLRLQGNNRASYAYRVMSWGAVGAGLATLPLTFITTQKAGNYLKQKTVVELVGQANQGLEGVLAASGKTLATLDSVEDLADGLGFNGEALLIGFRRPIERWRKKGLSWGEAWTKVVQEQEADLSDKKKKLTSWSIATGATLGVAGLSLFVARRIRARAQFNFLKNGGPDEEAAKLSQEHQVERRKNRKANRKVQAQVVPGVVEGRPGLSASLKF